MRDKLMKQFFFISMTLTLLQCQAKPKVNALDDSSTYRELTELIQNSDRLSGGVSFVAAAAISTPCVVHIKTKVNVAVSYHHPFQGFFGQDFFNQPRIHKQESSGSGVIIAEDGYIVTNFHVIQNASEIEVILRNKNSYKAKVIGHDKETDLALIKIEESQLPSMQLANSDSVMVGEWVLAVGNPFNLESTVTQGIVSAKGRALNLGESNGTNPIESFIQTDAAVNPGNSGGALVNLKGELIGINTAIASPTGAYAGYSFAVPSNLVKKVIDDLKKFGNVQRAYLGINAQPLTSQLAKELSLRSPSGVLIRDVIQGSAADEAGLKPNDVIVKLNDHLTSSFPELREYVNTFSPGDKINITFIRNGQEKSATATLKNSQNNTQIIKSDMTNKSKLGIQLQAMNPSEARQFGIRGGLKVTKLENGMIAQLTELKAGFIIVSINDEEVLTEDDFQRIIQSKKGSNVILEGFYPNRPYTFQYAFKYN